MALKVRKIEHKIGITEEERLLIKYLIGGHLTEVELNSITKVNYIKHERFNFTSEVRKPHHYIEKDLLKVVE